MGPNHVLIVLKENELNSPAKQGSESFPFRATEFTYLVIDDRHSEPS